MKKKIFYIISALLLFCLCAVLQSTDFSAIYELPSSFYASDNEIQKVNDDETFGKFVRVELGKETLTSTQNSQEKIITFKLFGIIPIRKVVAKILPEERVYIGGNPIGISVCTDKGIVVGKSRFGEQCEGVNHGYLKQGDVIYKINGEEIDSLDELAAEIEMCENGVVEIEYFHDGKLHKKRVKANLDEDGKYKLGFTVNDIINGIGTLTYVCEETHNFGALGHPICDNVESLKLLDGGIYNCTLLGIEKGESNNPGQLKGIFVEGKDQKGRIEANNKFGVYGKLEDMSIIDTNKTAKLGGRLSVKPGKASIISSISGISEEYSIEIIKVNNQKEEKDKSFVFRVTDKRLLELSGGIVQGMSGSPIVQNGKIIGAVTHVFTIDATKGYGVYTDWMIENHK